MQIKPLKYYLEKLPRIGSSYRETETRLPHLSSKILEQVQRALQRVNPLTQRDHFSITFSSCNKGAGVTMIAMNFANALAKKGKKTVLIEANFRSPCLSAIFNLQQKPGLMQLLHGKSALEEAIHVIDTAGFAVITSGTNGEKVSPSLDKLPELLSRLQSEYEAVIIDTAPILPYFEPTILASSTDGFVLVLETDNDKWEVAQSANKILSEANVNVLGAILNRKRYYIPQFVYDFL